MTNITQEDREASARWFAQEYSVEMDCLVCQSILSGEEDCQDRVAVFARHREAAAAKERERIVAQTLSYVVSYLRECSENAMENGYNDHAEGVGEAADLVADLSLDQILMEVNNATSD